jgi:LysR family transcriptional activator of dmlA
VNNLLENADLRVFVTVARQGSFAGAAQALGMSAAYVSKRIGVLEAALGVRLFQRTTRRVVITEDGAQAFERAQAILDSLDDLIEESAERRRAPSGQLRVCSSFGFGRQVVAPAIARLARAYPALQIRFEVFDRLVDPVAEGFDLDVRIGDEIAPQLIARRLMVNHRILCAAPAYLAQHGTPRTLQDLEETVKVSGALSTNHGEVALRWALDGAGIVLRSRWHAQPLLAAGQLVQILPEFAQEANVWAVYPQRLGNSAKVRVCVEFLERELAAGEAPDLGV